MSAALHLLTTQYYDLVQTAVRSLYCGECAMPTIMTWRSGSPAAQPRFNLYDVRSRHDQTRTAAQRGGT